MTGDRRKKHADIDPAEGRFAKTKERRRRRREGRNEMRKEFIELRRKGGGYLYADKVEDQRALSQLGWGSKVITESNLDELLAIAGEHGYGLEVEVMDNEG